jgi:Uma2 family endonuclease
MATPATESKPLTVEDMYSMPRDGRKYELIEGELVVSPAGMKHEEIGVELLLRLRAFLGQHRLGKVFGSSAGFELASGNLLSPDVSFVRMERFPDGVVPDTFGRFAPDLAVEVLSPSDSMARVEQKVDLYLENGAQLVWVINPKAARATVYRADGSAAIIRADGALDGEAVLPGFRCALAEIL